MRGNRANRRRQRSHCRIRSIKLRTINGIGARRAYPSGGDVGDLALSTWCTDADHTEWISAGKVVYLPPNDCTGCRIWRSRYAGGAQGDIIGIAGYRAVAKCDCPHSIRLAGIAQGDRTVAISDIGVANGDSAVACGVIIGSHRYGAIANCAVGIANGNGAVARYGLTLAYRYCSNTSKNIGFMTDCHRSDSGCGCYRTSIANGDSRRCCSVCTCACSKRICSGCNAARTNGDRVRACSN